MPITIGCDVSKKKIDVCILEDGNKVLESFDVTNTKEGLRSMIEKISSWKDAPIMLEPTGYYHYLFVFGLRESGFSVRLVNPYVMKQFTKLGLRKTKTDRVDAKQLARIGCTNLALQAYTETPAQVQKKAKIQTIHRLADNRRTLIQRQHQLEEMHEAIGGLSEAIRAFEIVVHSMDREIKKLEHKLLEDAGEDEKLIASIPGISLLSACAIIGELGDRTRFKDRDALTAFAGLDPTIGESGSSVHQKSRLSKHGSSMLRRSLVQCAWGAMMHNARYQEYFVKKKEEGKHYFTILSAIARKLLTLIRSMLLSRSAYDPLKLSTKICLTPV